MKKYYLFIIAITILFMTTSCEKENEKINKYPKTVNVELKIYPLNNTETIIAREIQYSHPRKVLKFPNETKLVTLRSYKLPFDTTFNRRIEKGGFGWAEHLHYYGKDKDKVILEIIIDGKSVSKDTTLNNDGWYKALQYQYPK